MENITLIHDTLKTCLEVVGVGLVIVGAMLGYFWWRTR